MLLALFKVCATQTGKLEKRSTTPRYSGPVMFVVTGEHASVDFPLLYLLNYANEHNAPSSDFKPWLRMGAQLSRLDRQVQYIVQTLKHPCTTSQQGLMTRTSKLTCQKKNCGQDCQYSQHPKIRSITTFNASTTIRLYLWESHPGWSFLTHATPKYDLGCHSHIQKTDFSLIAMTALEAYHLLIVSTVRSILGRQLVIMCYCGPFSYTLNNSIPCGQISWLHVFIQMRERSGFDLLTMMGLQWSTEDQAKHRTEANPVTLVQVVSLLGRRDNWAPARDRLLCFVVLASFTMRYPLHRFADRKIVIYCQGIKETSHWPFLSVGAMRARVNVRCFRAKLPLNRLPVSTTSLSPWALHKS